MDADVIEQAHEVRRREEEALTQSGVALHDLPPPDPHLRRACRRVPVKEVAPGVMMAGPVRIPPRMHEMLEQNQKLASCCRHPEGHTFSAWYTSAEDEAKGVPDVYIFHCTCGRVHRRFMLGGALTPQGQGETEEAFAKRKAAAPPGAKLRRWEAESDEAYAHRASRAKRPFWEIR